jgi:hypothetical protein
MKERMINSAAQQPPGMRLKFKVKCLKIKHRKVSTY